MMCDVNDMYDSGYEDSYDWVYEKGIIFEDDDTEDTSEYLDHNEEEDDNIEEVDVILECPSEDEEIGIA
jgi:hypothetical protein